MALRAIRSSGVRLLAVIVLLASIVSAPSARPAAAAAPSCGAFETWEWAQSVFEADPTANAALDPDGDGLVCETLPHGFAPALWADHVPDDVTPATVLSITDGDTLKATIDGQKTTVRLYLMNTPEIHSPSQPVQCGGDLATEALQALVALAPNKTLLLEYDKTKTDRYGRRLAYAWFERDGSPYLINEAMVRAGYAELKVYKPDVKYEPQIGAAADFAKEHQVALWPTCHGFEVPLGQTPTPLPIPATVGASQAPAQSGSCDPSYPTVCIAPPSQVGDLDCKDVPYRRFEVLPPDPHHFDTDHDGVGCES
jgi:micrococcal nuclease